MKFEKQWNAVKSFFKSIGARNLIIIGAVLLVGTAIAVNWVYFAGQNDDPSGDLPAGGDAGDGGAALDSYFTATEISRQRARDEAMQVLQNVIDDESLPTDAKAEAVAGMEKLAKEMAAEANIESLLLAKGFEKCVAVINGDVCNIVVAEKGLEQNRIAQINAVVYEQTGIRPQNITIIEHEAT